MGNKCGPREWLLSASHEVNMSLCPYLGSPLLLLWASQGPQLHFFTMTPVSLPWQAVLWAICLCPRLSSGEATMGWSQGTWVLFPALLSVIGEITLLGLSLSICKNEEGVEPKQWFPWVRVIWGTRLRTPSPGLHPSLLLQNSGFCIAHR